MRKLILLAASVPLLAGCFAPMTMREAQSVASESLTKYCRGKCGAITLGRTQRIKSRYLVDFDAPRQRFTVIVENDGNAKVTAWDKGVETPLVNNRR